MRSFITGIPIVLIILVLIPNVYAGNPPTHTTLLYSSSLDSDNDPAVGQITNNSGQFITGSGWKATNESSQLMITLPSGLPLEGTFSVQVTNFNPAVQNISDKQQIINLYSQANGSKDILGTHGSWINIRTGTGYSDGAGMAGYKMLAAYDGQRHEDRYMHDATWNVNRTYEFKLVWNETSVWTIVDDVVQGEMEMTGSPTELFRYIFLGTDNVYVAQPGPIYKNMRIYSSQDPSSDVLLFTDITSQAGVGGVDPEGYGHGVNFSDFNLDGYLDIMSSNAGGPTMPEEFYLNQQNNTFSEIASSRNISDEGHTHGIISADWDNDGDLDVFMTNQPVNATNPPPGRNRMYRNDGNGNFTDVSDLVGIEEEYFFSRGAVASDINNDGWLDLYVLNWGDPNVLYLNDGDGTFTRVNRGTDGPAGDENGRQGVTAADVDNDGDIDFYVCRREAENWLFINDGNGNFTNEASARGVNVGDRSHGAAFVDIDNDGDLDLFIMNYALGGTASIPRMSAFYNNGNGYFTDQTDKYNIYVSGYSLIFGDVDNDADQDMYLIRNDEKEEGTTPKLYLNDGNGNLTLRNIAGASPGISGARGAGFGDIDNDGDLDAYIAAVYTDNVLLRNDLSSDNHYIDVLCIGPGGDYGGYGSKVSVYESGHMGDVNYLLGYQEAVTTVAYMCQNQTALHFGLAQNTACDIKVEFTNGQIAEYYSVSADQFFEVTANPPVPTSIARVSNAVLSGPAGQVLADSAKIQVVDESGRGVPNHTVSFQITNGGGTLNGSTRTQVDTTTDNHGYAAIGWKIGTDVNIINTLSVSAQNEGIDLIGSPMNFTANVNPGADTLITKHAGDLQNSVPEIPLPDSIQVRIHDTWGNPHANANVNFTVISGNGNIDGSVSKVVQTNAAGIASVQWTLGEAEGENAHSLKASLASEPLTSVTFLASTSLAPIKTLKYISGNNQTGTVTQDLANPFVVQLLDSLGNPRGGFDILFKVTGGSGNLGGLAEQTVKTDVTGKASVTLTLGQAAGTNLNTVEASYAELDDKIIFTASATSGTASKINKTSGDNQSAGVGQTLTNPLKVRVLDVYNNPVSGHNVIFTVNNNKGLVNNNLSATVQTDASGYATADFSMDNEPGTHSVTVTSTYNSVPLTGSPITFTATATSEPTTLVKVSGDSTTGIVGQPITLPLQVKVTDDNGFPVSNYPVTFVSESGGATFEGNLQIQQTTNEQGIASVYPTLGERVGPYVYIFTAKAFFEGGSHLNSSPLTFRLSAKSTRAEKIELIAGANQNGQAGEYLASAIQVLITDNENNVIANHNVNFTVKQGSGKLGTSKANSLTIKSGANGVAKVNFMLGSEIGDSVHVVEITSDDGIEVLENSPLYAYGSAEYGQPNADSSKLYISDSVVPADGTSELLVSAQLKDSQGLPVPGETAEFMITGDGNTITQSEGPSDENGMVSARITSTVAQSKTVTAKITDKAITINDTKVVEFTAGPADAIEIASGDDQSGTINSVLQQPLIVQVVDAMGNAISNHPVQFAIATGNGSLDPTQVENTNDSGKTQTNWILGPQIGSQTVTATAQGIAQSVTFTATAQMPGTAYITKVKGDEQFASPGTIFSDSLTVKIVDENNKPISGTPVKFSIEQGDASFTSISSINSDSYGLARIQLLAGQLLGTVTINASINETSSVDFLCSVSSSLPDTLIHILGDNTEGTVDATIYPLTAKVLDNNGVAISGVPITFASLTAGGQVIDEQPIRTTSNGQASARVKLGTIAGEYIFTASNASIKGSPVTFTLKALPDNASDIVVKSGNEQTGEALATLADSLTVQVVDEYQNGVAGVQVVFTVGSGQGSIQAESPLITNNNGLASAEWTLGASGTQQVNVTSGVLPGKSAQFTANLKANNLPVIQVVTDTTITENQTLIFTVQANDPEGTAVTLSASNLPAGAEFDSLETWQFSWTPGYNSQGDYTIRFTATDENGGTAIQDVALHVANMNRKPVVQSTIPEQTTLSLNLYAVSAFEVHVTDADNDPLTFLWFVDNNPVSTQQDSNRLIIQPNDSWPQQFKVDVNITDGIDTTHHAWSIDISSSIELAAFEAYTDKDLVTITWETASEHNTAGFNLYRAPGKLGPYTKINSELILPVPGGEYEIQDKPGAETLNWYYKLEEMEYSGRTQSFDPIQIQIAVPTDNILHQNYPNPFNPTTTLQYELNKTQQIDIYIFNIHGQLVRTIYSGKQKAGYHQIMWDSKNDNGISVTSGIYYCCMVGTDYRNTIKLVLLK